MRAIKALGQNYLISPATISTIVAYIISHTKLPLIEVGPGKGALTIPLLQAGFTMTCIEKDSFSAYELENKIQKLSTTNIQIKNADILNCKPPNCAAIPYDLVGSLPFNISKRIIHQFLCTDLPYPEQLFCIVQLEVGQKYTAAPPENTALAATARIYGESEFIFTIPKTHFSPIPKVDSAFIHFVRKSPPTYHQQLADFIHLLFRNPRKKLKSTLNQLEKKAQEMKVPQIKTLYDGALFDKRPQELTDNQMLELFLRYNYAK